MKRSGTVVEVVVGVGVVVVVGGVGMGVVVGVVVGVVGDREVGVGVVGVVGGSGGERRRREEESSCCPLHRSTQEHMCLDHHHSIPELEGLPSECGTLQTAERPWDPPAEESAAALEERKWWRLTSTSPVLTRVPTRAVYSALCCTG